MSEDATRNSSSDDLLRQILSEVRGFNERVSALEARAYDTRPIWEKALQEIVEARQEIRERLERLESEMRQMNRRFGVLAQDVVTLRADVDDLYTRQHKLEPPR